MQLSVYVRFNDKKCREAMGFYQSIFGGKVTFQTVAESPMAADFPAGERDRVMHATLKTNDLEFFGADMMRDKAVVGDNVVMSLNFTDEKSIRDIFAKLSEGGEVFMPLEKAFWGALFGVVTDKYGIEWMLNFQMEPVRTK